jgi:hypothetical protein
VPDQRLPLAVPGERDQVGCREPLADRGCLAEDLVRRRRTAAEQRGKAGREQQQPPLGAVEVLDQPLGPGDPTAAAGQVAAQDQGQRQPEPTARGTGRVLRAEVLEVGPLPGRLARGVPAGQVGGDRQQLEVGSGQV